MSLLDSNQDQQVQSLLCYLYTTRQYVGTEGVEPSPPAFQAGVQTTLHHIPNLSLIWNSNPVLRFTRPLHHLICLRGRCGEFGDRTQLLRLNRSLLEPTQLSPLMPDIRDLNPCSPLRQRGRDDQTPLMPVMSRMSESNGSSHFQGADATITTHPR
jgi:hypothetical protein